MGYNWPLRTFSFFRGGTLPWFYYAGRILLYILLPLLTHWQVKGKKNIPDQGPLLVVANHLNLVDPPVLANAIKRKAIFMAKEELFRSRLGGYFVRSFGSFPVHRGRLDRTALRQAEKVLAEGMILIMFPEASRSQNIQLQSPFPGSVLIARRSSVPILPIGITGTERIKGLGWILCRPRITVNIGSPFHLPAVNGKPTKSELAELSDLMMRRIAELLPEEYRGNYATERETDGVHV